MNLSKIVKKICAMLLTLVLLTGFSIPASVIFVSAESKIVTAAAINTVRETGQLVIYSSKFGPTTNTNKWGYEVTVLDNKVTKVGGYNSDIPSNGFVLSGHDNEEGTDNEKNKTYLMKNVKVGDYVYYNESTLAITISDEPITPSSFYSLTQDFDAINENRNVDLLVIYNKKGTHTDTNQWGYEVVCENGVVVSLGGNDNLIPNSENSFVVSGHGTMAEWLNSKVKVGMAVTYDTVSKKINFVYDEKTAAMGINLNINTLEVEYNSSLENYSYIDYKTVGIKFEKLKNDFNAANEAYKKDGKVEDFDAACIEASKLIDEITLLLVESRTVEYRGVWLRPIQKTTEEVENYVQKLYDAGINLICIETLYDSTMIMPMPKDSLFKQNPEWKGFDMLKAFIDACHKRDMELHVWMPIFYVGHKDGKNDFLSVAKQKPEWLSVNNKGGNYSDEDEASFQLLNPANPEVTEFLLETYRYILNKYNIDGFELDYIRYYKRTTACDFGYDEITTKAFKEKYGVEPKYDQKASYWNDWVAFRTQYITDMVEKVKNLVNEVRPSVLLSAAVVPKSEDAYNNVYQNYMNWIDNGYLNLLHPMSYGDGFEDEIEAQIKHCGDKVFIAVGLGIFMPELSAKDMLRQAKMVNALGGDGSAYFEASSYLSKGTGAVLNSSIYRNRAITPTLNKKGAIVESLNYSIARINDIVLPREGMTADEANDVKNAFDSIIKAVNDGAEVKDTFASAKTAVNKMANENAKATILKDLAYAEKISATAERIPDRIDVIENESEKSLTLSDDVSTEIKSDNNDWVLPVVIIAVVVLIASAAILFFLRKKK